MTDTRSAPPPQPDPIDEEAPAGRMGRKPHVPRPKPGMRQPVISMPVNSIDKRTTSVLRGVLDLIEPRALRTRPKVVTGKVSRLAESQWPAFCLVLNGRLEAEIEGAGTIELCASDFLLMPSGTRFSLVSQSNQVRTLLGSAESAHSVVVTGSFGISWPDDNLSDWQQFGPVVLRGASNRRIDDPGVEQRKDVGTDPFDAELMILFAKALAANVNDSQPAGLLRALSFPPMAKALLELQRHPEKNWSTETMVATFGISRSVIYDMFDRLFARTPGEVVRTWRMALARKSVRSPNSTLEEVAKTIGFNGHAAVGRAFKRTYGVAPGSYRSEQRASEKGHALELTNQYIAPALEAIDADLARNWEIDDLRALGGLSRSHFIKVFTEVLGVAPGKYLQQRRLDRAQELLASGMHVKRVAAAVGYEGPSALRRAIRRSGPRSALAGTHP